MKNRVLIFTDSLALPRDKPEVCIFERTWVELLRKDGYIIHQVSIGGATSQELSRQVHYHTSFNPDIVIVQVGIVDCAPRFMTRYEISFWNLFGAIGRKVIKSFNKNWIRKIRGITYVNKTNFKVNLNFISDLFKNKAEVYFIEILPATTDYRKLLPGVEKNIFEYNKIIRTFNNCIELKNIPMEGIMSDGHHLNQYGQKFIYSEIKSRLSKTI